jgi:hypothetical protein
MRMIAGLIIVISCLLTTIELISAEPAMPDSIVRLGACATPGIAWGVFVQSDCAYVADAGATTVIDVSSPSSPWVVSSLNTTPDAWAQGLFMRDTLAYPNHTGMGSGFAVLSAANSGSLYVLGWCYAHPASGPTPTGVYATDTLTYLANGDDGLGILDVSNPASPDTVRYFNTPGYALDLSVCDTLAFVADYDSLMIVSIADALNPYRVGAVSMPRSCYGVFVSGEYAYVVCQSTSGIDGTLQVVNISDPASAQIVASIDNIKGDPLDIWISGSYAYVAAADYWASHEDGPRRVGGIRIERDVKIQADVDGGLSVVDISDPLSPSLVATYQTPGDPRGVFATGGLAFIADYDSVQILRHVEVGVEEKPAYPREALSFRLGQNRPNPFRGHTRIQYSVSERAYVTLRVYDVTGQLVETLVSGEQEAGDYSVEWDASGAASGMYFCCLATGPRSVSTMMMKVR